MKVLTPTGYQDATTLAADADVCAFDAETGVPIVNHVEALQPVDYAEWCRWWQVEETVPAFNWVRVNGSFLLFGEQSIWRNGTSVCHAKHLVVGDEIYDDADQPVPITTIETVTDESLIWYRFDISGDHSYIIDGLTVHNASRYWVGGTGTWDASTTTNWAATTGGTGGQSVPGSADTVTFDASSGSGGVCTLNFGGTIAVQSISISGTFTWDNSVNNNNISLSSNSGFITSATAVTVVKFGTATYTLSTTATSNPLGVTRGATLFAGSETWVFSGVTQNIRTISSWPTLGTLTINANCGPIKGAVGPTFGTVNMNGGTCLFLSGGWTVGTLNISGSSSAPIGLMSYIQESQTTISVASGTQTMNWVAIKNVKFQGGATFLANDSFDLGNNSGVTITPPSVGGGSSGFGVIGS